MAESEGNKRIEDNPEYFRKLVFRGWLIVCGIAVAFILYGLFAFFVIGDKQSTEWDFGEMEDIPGESAYSTFPYRGRANEPEPQHIDRKPMQAEPYLSDNPPPPPGTEEKGFEETGARGSEQTAGPTKKEPGAAGSR